MQIKLDGETKVVKTDSVTNLNHIVEQVQSFLTNNRLITKVVLNDKTLDGNWHVKAESIYILDDDKLEFTTQNADKLGAAALVDTLPHFEEMLKDFERIADMLRMEDETKANQHLAQALDNLKTYFNIVQNAYALMEKEVNLPRPSPDESFVESLSRQLSGLIEIQKNQDWILLADMIEYELIPLLSNIKQIY